MFIFHLVKKKKTTTLNWLTEPINSLTTEKVLRHSISLRTVWYCCVDSHHTSVNCRWILLASMRWRSPIRGRAQGPGGKFAGTLFFQTSASNRKTHRNTKTLLKSSHSKPRTLKTVSIVIWAFFNAHLISWTVVSALSRQSRTQPAFLQPLQVDITISGLRTWPSK